MSHVTFVEHCIRDQQCPQATTGTFSLSPAILQPVCLLILALLFLSLALNLPVCCAASEESCMPNLS